MAETRLPPWTPTQERVGSVFIRLMTAANVWLFRLSGGRFGARFPGGAPICLVTTRGRKSGDRRTSARRSEEHTSELQSQFQHVCRLLHEKKKNTLQLTTYHTHARILKALHPLVT